MYVRDTTYQSSRTTSRFAGLKDTVLRPISSNLLMNQCVLNYECMLKYFQNLYFIIDIRLSTEP